MELTIKVCNAAVCYIFIFFLFTHFFYIWTVGQTKYKKVPLKTPRDRVLPKKSSVKVYRENKAAVMQMLAAGEINQEEAEDLYNKQKADFLSSKAM